MSTEAKKLSANVPGLTFTDSSLVPGLLRYQVAALDFVQHRGPSIGMGRIWAGPVDAGVADAGVTDAGVTDAGVMDAGVADAGMAEGPDDGGIPGTQTYAVGCGCSSAESLLVLLAQAILLRRRRARPGER